MMNSKHFLKTREYLEQVKEAAQKVEMLKKRIEFAEEAGVDTASLVEELDAARKEQAQKMVEVSGMIAKVPKVSYQWLLTKRYVELLGWDDIAYMNNTSHRNVISEHGLALPEMQDVLMEAGIVAEEDADDVEVIMYEAGADNIGTMKDYLNYREEKRTEQKSSIRL